MPVFTSMDEIKQYILSNSRDAVEAASNRVYQVLHDFMEQYYKEYSPKVYQATFQMLSSLVKEDVVSTGNGWSVKVYFDVGALDYSFKIMTKHEVEGGFINPYNHAFSPSGIFENPYGSAEKSLSAAMHGSHGGKASGTAVWDESMIVLKAELIDALKGYLKANGIPVA